MGRKNNCLYSRDWSNPECFALMASPGMMHCVQTLCKILQGRLTHPSNISRDWAKSVGLIFAHLATFAFLSTFVFVKLQRKKSFSILPSPAGMSLTKLSLGRNNLLYIRRHNSRPGRVWWVTYPGWGQEYWKAFLQCTVTQAQKCCSHVSAWSAFSNPWSKHY